MRSIVDKFNTAAIYITHDLAVVAQMADRIKVLRYGEEVEEADEITGEEAVVGGKVGGKAKSSKASVKNKTTKTGKDSKALKKPKK